MLGPYGGSAPGHRMTTFLLNETTSLDAGALTAMLSLGEQRRVDRVVITHSHFDHVATLRFCVENVFGRAAIRSRSSRRGRCSRLCGATSSRGLCGRIFPSFPRAATRPLVCGRRRGHHLPRRMISRFTPFPSTTSFRRTVISFEGRASILFSGDTAPTERLWQLADRADEPEGDLSRGVVLRRSRRRGGGVSPPHTRADSRRSSKRPVSRFRFSCIT